MTPEDEVDEIDRTVIPTSRAGWGQFILGYRFPYLVTEYERRRYFDLEFLGPVDGKSAWILKEGDFRRYNKRTRRWEQGDRRYEPDCRMTLDEARKIVPRVIYYQNHHARRMTARNIRMYRWRQEQNVRKAAMQQVADLLAAKMAQGVRA